jgi:hypothetical protein
MVVPAETFSAGCPPFFSPDQHDRMSRIHVASVCSATELARRLVAS